MTRAQPLRAGALGLAVAAIGYRRGALSKSGAAGAAAIGAVTFGAGSWRWSAPLLAFFVGSSALSRLERSGKGAAGAEFNPRGARRDIIQVLANGGPAAIAALTHIAVPHPAFGSAFAGAIAAANGDTWATEIGALSPLPPRMILKGGLAPAGTSGAITPLGMAASAAGSALIGLAAGLALEGPRRVRRALAVTLAGMAGALIDSVAGETMQAGYLCPQCTEPTERRVHHCGTTTILSRGKAWCNNDVVNALCTSVGAVVAAALSEVQLKP
ncbi:MAG: DUF92 domain-containing protein [Chloroflexota bacterium]